MPDLRALLLDTLDKFYCPLTHAELSAYLRVFHEIDLTQAKVSAVRRDEQQAHRAGEHRGVWLCPAILQTAWGFRAAEGLLTRSDWPLATRIVYQGADAVRQVWLTKLLCHFTSVALEQDRPAAQVLTQEASRRAELLLCADDVRWRLQPENAEDEHVVAERLAAFQRDLSFRLMLWSEAAEDAFGNLIDHDRTIRQRLAAQLERLDQDSILFGAQPAA
jgi:hypothetical protein